MITLYNIKTKKKYDDLSQISDPTRKLDAVWLYEIHMGNPNGDPDNANNPRMTFETGKGLVTGISVKRKIRDYVREKYGETKNGDKGFDTYYRQDDNHNTLMSRRAELIKKNSKANEVELVKLLQNEYYDVRMFGAVTDLEKKNSPINNTTGPICVTNLESFDVINPLSVTITRNIAENNEDKARDMGNVKLLHYALYKGHIFVSPTKITNESVDQTDLEYLWESMLRIYEMDKTAARGQQRMVGAVVFKHRDKYGSLNGRATDLFNRLQVKHSEAFLNSGRATTESLEDYDINFNANDLPEQIDAYFLGFDLNDIKITDANSMTQAISATSISLSDVREPSAMED